MECLVLPEGQSPLARCFLKSMKFCSADYGFDEMVMPAVFLDPLFKWTLYSNNIRMKMPLAHLAKRETGLWGAELQQHGKTARVLLDSTLSTLSADLWGAFQRLAKCSEQGESMLLSETEVRDYVKESLLGRYRGPCR